MNRRIIGIAASATVLVALAPSSLASTPTQSAGAVATHARGRVEMTPQEYRKVKNGMTTQKVKHIVGSDGTVEQRTKKCLVKTYEDGQLPDSGFMGEDYYVRWTKKSGIFKVTGKGKPGTFTYCDGTPGGA